MLVLFMSILMLLGLIVIYSISPALTARINAAGNQLSQDYFMYKQLLYLLAGVVAFLIVSFIPLSFWQKNQGKILVGALILCLIPIVFAGSSFVLCTNGACRWLNLGFSTLQPAEALKFALLIFVAGFLANRISLGKINSVNETLVPLGMLMLLVSIIIIGLQKDLGTGIAMFGIVAIMLYVGGLNKKYILLTAAALLAAGVIFTLTSPHRMERITTFVSGASDSDDSSGYHINQALIAIGSGGVSGKGLGRSIQAFGYLPEAANDSIFAIVAEKFGFIGTSAILVIFGGLFFRLLKIMDNVTIEYNKLIIAGVFGWVFTHAVVNVGAMLGLLPLTGVTLPFLSFGGTSLLFIMMALGLAFQVSRYTVHQTTDGSKGVKNEDRSSGRGVRWARNSRIGRN
ncbi:MAG: FtsW/RodA/SpoVE family cell cycle protein [Candidatus Woesebacteria bacterium]|jgi:cell division protein FtsW